MVVRLQNEQKKNLKNQWKLLTSSDTIKVKTSKGVDADQETEDKGNVRWELLPQNRKMFDKQVRSKQKTGLQTVVKSMMWLHRKRITWTQIPE